MKVYVTFERAIKDFEIPDDHNFIGEVKKQCCPYFNVQPEEVVMRSGTRPIREDMPLRKDHSITMARIKPAKQEEKEEEYEYTYEEEYDESSYDPNDSDYTDTETDEDEDDDEEDEDTNNDNGEKSEDKKINE